MQESKEIAPKRNMEWGKVCSVKWEREKKLVVFLV